MAEPGRLNKLCALNFHAVSIKTIASRAAAGRGHRRGHCHRAGARLVAERRRFSPGRRAFRPVTLFDVSRQRAKTAAEMDLPAALLPKKIKRRQLARLATRRPCCCSPRRKRGGRRQWQPAENLPLVFGTTSGEMSSGKIIFVRRLSSHTGIGDSRPAEFITSRRSRRVWFWTRLVSRPNHHRLQCLRLRQQCHRPRLGNLRRDEAD